MERSNSEHAPELDAPERTVPPRRAVRWRRAAVLVVLGLIAAALVVAAIGSEERTDDARVRSAAMFQPGPGRGPEVITQGARKADFGPLQPFGVQIKYAEPTETLSLTSIGEVTVTHMAEPATSQGFAACCYLTPPTPGRYRLVIRARVASGTEFTFELPYTVNPPQ